MTGAQTTQQDIGAIFNALGDKTRRQIFERITLGPQTVSQLSGPLGITLTAVSQHLQVMEECSLIRTVKRGRVRECSINEEGLAAMQQWIALTRQRWQTRLNRLNDVLGEDDERQP